MYGHRMRISSSLVVAFCGLICALMLPASAGAKLGPAVLPAECVFEEGELGHYIVVFYDWVEDPETVAREQVEQYGGNLGFVYKNAPKGYSVEFPPQSAEALQAEPTVNYIEVNQLIWMDESSGIIQWHSCPLAPPLGPKPPTSPELPGELEQPKAPDGLEPSVEPPPESWPSNEQRGEEAESRVNRCRKGRVRKGNRCVPKRGQLDSGTCKKRKGAGKRCLHGHLKTVWQSSGVARQRAI
jgi:peptidase inhibitor I9